MYRPKRVNPIIKKPPPFMDEPPQYSSGGIINQVNEHILKAKTRKFQK